VLVARGTTGQVFLQIRAFVYTPEFFNVGYSDVAESRVPLLVEKEGHHAVVVRITVMGPVRIVVRETLMNAAIMRGGFDSFMHSKRPQSWSRTQTSSWCHSHSDSESGFLFFPLTLSRCRTRFKSWTRSRSRSGSRSSK